MIEKKKVTWERGNCLDGHAFFPVNAGNGLIFTLPPPTESMPSGL